MPVLQVVPQLTGCIVLQEAEAEKEAAGEGKNVEHVALQIDDLEAVAVAAGGAGAQAAKHKSNGAEERRNGKDGKRKAETVAESGRRLRRARA